MRKWDYLCDMSQPPPLVSVILICDIIIRDEASRKYSLIGIIKSLEAGRFPYTRESLSAYAMLTDAEGRYAIRLALVRLEDLAVFREIVSIEVRLHERNAVGELVLDLPGIIFERPGRYEFQLYANNRLVGVRALNVIQGSHGLGAHQ